MVEGSGGFIIRLEGLDELNKDMEELKKRFYLNIRRLIFTIGLQAIMYTKMDWLTSKGRVLSPWIVARSGRRYRKVVDKGEEDKIGVITGRLRASYGTKRGFDSEVSKWSLIGPTKVEGGEEYEEGDAIYNMDENEFKLEIGTNVEYAKYLAWRKYDFALKGLEDAYNKSVEPAMRLFLKEVFRGE